MLWSSLEEKKILSSLTFDNQKSKNERYSAESIEAVIKAVYDMARVKTGALIVVEKETSAASMREPEFRLVQKSAVSY